MREILFRGKRKFGGTWNYGDLVHCTDNLVAVSDEQGNFVNVHPETVGQYTGLTDKNGKKIFEGDLLDCEDRICVVSWHEKCGTWDCNFVRYKGKICSNGITPVEWKYRAEVIGNIHDNPELMKGGE